MGLPKIDAEQLQDIFDCALEEDDDEILLLCTIVSLLSEQKKEFIQQLMPFKKAMTGSSVLFYPEVEDEED